MATQLSPNVEKFLTRSFAFCGEAFKRAPKEGMSEAAVLRKYLNEDSSESTIAHVLMRQCKVLGYPLTTDKEVWDAYHKMCDVYAAYVSHTQSVDDNRKLKHARHVFEFLVCGGKKF